MLVLSEQEQGQPKPRRFGITGRLLSPLAEFHHVPPKIPQLNRSAHEKERQHALGFWWHQSC